MPDRSKLVSLKIRNIGCIGPEGLEVALDNIVCLVGRNNTGKTTILRAYELAQGSQPLMEHDRCHWTPEGDVPEVELVVHIPAGIPNVDAKWKIERDGLKLVRSRWQWKALGEKPVRQTWDPETSNGTGGWADDGKAGGADNVFNSRLPQPLRVDSLQDAFKEHDELLKLVTEPVAQELRGLQTNPESRLHQAIGAVVEAAMAPVTSYQADIDRIGQNVGAGFKGVFPELDIRIQIGMDPPSIDAAKALVAGSSVRIIEGASEMRVKQQGTGSRRALFWALLQVRNSLSRERKTKDDREKQITKLKKDIEKEQSKKFPNTTKIQEFEADVRALQDGSGAVDDLLALPGHILLIDEPENALHPMAVRAARDHLYALARDPNWQVLLSTHSPYFIDPLEDHTTIVRLERDGTHTSPRTFRTETAQFGDTDKENLRALLQLDNALAEMFFGSYPIIVEGDTELAAFVAAALEEVNPLSQQVTLVPARGKALIETLVRLMAHFEIPFGVLHDSDSPLRQDGKKNGAWTVNSNIAQAINAARDKGVTVRHRVNIPDFERFLGGFEETKDKPILAYRRLKADTTLRASALQLFSDLFGSDQHQPFDQEFMQSVSGNVIEALKKAVIKWRTDQSVNDPRFNFD